MNPKATETIHYLDNVGKVGLGVDKETHEILVMLKTPVGLLSETLDKEKALRLGIELVRLSGRTFRFPAAAPKEETHVEPDPAIDDVHGASRDLVRASERPADDAPASVSLAKVIDDRRHAAARTSERR